MQTTGIFFAMLTMLSWSICIFPFTQAARRIGSNALNLFRLFLAVVFLAAANLAIDHELFVSIFSSAHGYAWFWLGLSGIVGLTVGDYFAFRMYAIMDPRLGSVLTTLSPAATLISGYLMLGESINWIGISGIFITMFGVMGISLGRMERGKIPDRGHGSIFAGILFGIFSAVCQGVGLVLSKKGMYHEGFSVSALPASFIRILIAFISLFLFSLVRGDIVSLIRPVIRNENGGLRFAVAGTFFGPFLGMLLSLYTISNLDVSVGQTIFSLMPVSALLISRFFYKEKITFRSLIGIVVAISGVIILIWRMQLAELFL